MERIKNLNLFQKIVLIFLALMLVFFSAAYAKNSSRLGFEYMNKILIYSTNGTDTLYTGKIKGTKAVFTVTSDNTVTFRHGDKRYGPYTAVSDPTAAPKDHSYATGVVLYEGEDIIFRGGYVKTNNSILLFDETGSVFGLTVHYTDANGTLRDANGNIIDEMEPSPSTILELMDGPELQSKGSWLFWFYAFIISIGTVVSILFADELFFWSMSFRIRNAYRTEPSEWEMASRYIAWTVFPIAALVSYIVGLV